MDPVLNPYRPGAGRMPPVLAGRESILDAFDIVQRRITGYGEGDRSWVIDGLRGVGKTVLLGELHGRASESGWIAAKVEASGQTPLPVALAQGLVRSLRTATGKHPDSALRRLLGVFKSFSMTINPSGLTVGADVDLVAGVADSGRFADDLAALLEVMGEASAQLGIGTLILVDELQEATKDELVAVNTAVHAVNQGRVPLPVMFVGAGLPSLPALLADATSYAERLYDYRPVGLLDAAASRQALVGPSTERGVPWEPRAVDAAIALAGGYPYFLQAVGKHVWDLAPGPRITHEDVELGGLAARVEVDDGLYRSRWERATPAQRELLRVLARHGRDEPVPIAELVAPAGKRRVSDLSVARRELIRKGLVYSPERGLLAFTVPGFGAFVGRQDHELS